MEKQKSTSIFNTAIPKQSSNYLSSIAQDFDTRKSEREHRMESSRRTSFMPSTLGTSTATPLSPYMKEVAQRLKFDFTGFCTGSQYIGEFNQLGIAGKGVYKFPHGVTYDGFFDRNGEFHGTGILIYPNGQQVEGLWRHGKLMPGASCRASDNAAYSSNYCKMPDRRYQIEAENDLAPAPMEYLTNAREPRKIPPGMYDTGEGFYDPLERTIISYGEHKKKPFHEVYDDENNLMYYMKQTDESSKENFIAELSKNNDSNRKYYEIPRSSLEVWIMKRCRKAWDEPLGYDKSLYETWTAGYKKNYYTSDMTGLHKTQEDDIVNQMKSINMNTKMGSMFTKLRHSRFTKGFKVRMRRARGPQSISPCRKIRRETHRSKSH